MRLHWNGKDITDRVNIAGCVVRDYSGNKSDCLDLTLENAADWFRWGPEEDDEIVLTEGKYSTGRLFLGAVAPDGNRYRVLATSLPKAAGRRAWQSWNGTSLGAVFDACAAECGMEARIYGVSRDIPYAYLLRKQETAAGLLARVGEWEGMTVKAYDGVFRGIGITYAQERARAAAMSLDAEGGGAVYRNRPRVKWAGVEVRSPWAAASARDTAVTSGEIRVFPNLPARTVEQAGRWARGLLLSHNRTAETLEVSEKLNTDLLSMARADVTADGAMGGKWIIDEAEHDFVNETTRAVMYRVIGTVR